MSMDTNDVVVVAPPPFSEARGSYLEWSPILGGAVVSATLTSAMLAFGSALGLSLVSFDPGRSSSMVAIAIAAGLWAIWITISANAAGGYLAGRMRRPVGGASGHERSVRDGAHGLVVWAAGALLVMMVASSSLTGAARTAASGAAAASSGAADLLQQQADPLGSALDQVMRTSGATPPTAEERAEASRIFVSALASGQLAQSDRDYIASRMAARMNISEPEAQRRIDEAYAGLRQAMETARQAAERARRVALITAFMTASVLLLGGAVAWFAAQLGGRHRDDDKDLGGLFGR